MKIQLAYGWAKRFGFVVLRFPGETQTCTSIKACFIPIRWHGEWRWAGIGFHLIRRAQ